MTIRMLRLNPENLLSHSINKAQLFFYTLCSEKIFSLLFLKTLLSFFFFDENLKSLFQRL